jgi:hypothetical protein
MHNGLCSRQAHDSCRRRLVRSGHERKDFYVELRMSAIRSEKRTSYERAVYHIERMNVKEKFFRSPANRAQATIPTSEVGSGKTLAELEGSRECIKRCIHEKRSQRSGAEKFPGEVESCG